VFKKLERFTEKGRGYLLKKRGGKISEQSLRGQYECAERGGGGWMRREGAATPGIGRQRIGRDTGGKARTGRGGSARKGSMGKCKDLLLRKKLGWGGFSGVSRGPALSFGRHEGRPRKTPLNISKTRAGTHREGLLTWDLI